MSQIHREALTKFETVTLDYEIPVWKEGSNKDATLKRITLRDFFASDVISTVVDPPNWATEGLIVTGNHTHNFNANTVTLDGGTHIFGNSLIFRVNGSMFMPGVTQDDSLTKLAAFDTSTGQIKWKNASTLSGNYFDKTSDDTDDITEGVNKFVTAVQLTKLGHISVSQAVDLDQMESDIAVNNLKVTNVSTNLSEGTATNTTVDINSSDGTNATLASASTSRAGLLSKTKFDEIEANNLKVSNQDQDISGIATNASSIAGLGSYVSAVQASTVTNATAIALNTAKVTNATHTGEVTGSGALTIADGVVDAANLKVSNAATNGYVLTARPGTTEGLTWEASAAGNTNLSLSGSVSVLSIGSSTGSGITLPAASSSIAGLLTSAQFNDVVANTAKVGLTAAQVTTLNNTSGTNTGDQDISGIAINAAAIASLGTDLGITGSSNTTVTVTSSTGSNVTLPATTMSTAGVFTSSNLSKLSGIENLADVTDTTNVVAALTAGTNITISPAGVIDATGGSTSPLTLKGDLYTYDTANQRLPVGTNGQALVADSTASTGLKWKNLSETPAVGGGLLCDLAFDGDQADGSQNVNTTFEKLQFDSAGTHGTVIDVNSDWDNSTYEFVVSATSGAGSYTFDMDLFINDANYWMFRIMIGGVVANTASAGRVTDVTGHTFIGYHTAWTLDLAVGDRVSIEARTQTGTGAIGGNAGEWVDSSNAAGLPNTCGLAIRKVSGIKGDKGDPGTGAPVSLSKTITLEEPVSGDDITIFRTDVAITVKEVISVLVGSGTPVVHQLYHHGTRNSASANALTASQSVSTQLTGTTSTLSDDTIPADSWVWVKFTDPATATAGQYITIDVRYEE